MFCGVCLSVQYGHVVFAWPALFAYLSGRIPAISSPLNLTLVPAGSLIATGEWVLHENEISCPERPAPKIFVLLNVIPLQLLSNILIAVNGES